MQIRLLATDHPLKFGDAFLRPGQCIAPPRVARVDLRGGRLERRGALRRRRPPTGSAPSLSTEPGRAEGLVTLPPIVNQLGSDLELATQSAHRFPGLKS